LSLSSSFRWFLIPLMLLPNPRDPTRRQYDTPPHRSHQKLSPPSSTHHYFPSYYCFNIFCGDIAYYFILFELYPENTRVLLYISKNFWFTIHTGVLLIFQRISDSRFTWIRDFEE
jgi:hypothetical protein